MEWEREGEREAVNENKLQIPVSRLEILNLYSNVH